MDISIASLFGRVSGMLIALLFYPWLFSLAARKLFKWPTIRSRFTGVLICSSLLILIPTVQLISHYSQLSASYHQNMFSEYAISVVVGESLLPLFLSITVMALFVFRLGLVQYLIFLLFNGAIYLSSFLPVIAFSIIIAMLGIKITWSYYQDMILCEFLFFAIYVVASFLVYINKTPMFFKKYLKVRSILDESLESYKQNESELESKKQTVTNFKDSARSLLFTILIMFVVIIIFGVVRKIIRF